MFPEKNKSAFHKSLQAWFQAQGRELPWRDDPAPYRVLVSEFMLQQTTVAAVRGHFARWMRELPDVQTLAAAPEEKVLKLWEGLGYYSRARNLHRAAKEIVARFQGIIPDDPEILRTLPGIGPYTAAAIAAFAFDKPVPVLDANINRLIARLFDFREDITTAAGKTFLDQAAALLLPKTGGRAHTSALMDLGATLCAAGHPDCLLCPVQKFCRATDPTSLPIKPAKKAITRLVEWRALAIRKRSVFLIQSPGPRWKGLWLLPPAEHTDSEPLASLDYSITRYRVTLHLRDAEPQLEWIPHPLDNLPAMPTPHRNILALIKNPRANDARAT
jgi:A/G-specific adenine glycosylase